MQRKPRALAWVAAVLLGLALVAGASYLTTGMRWDGGYPFGEVRVLVVDQDGRPVPGASLAVFESTSGNVAGDYPLYENARDGGMQSGNDGVIVCHQIREGLQFGGFSWRLFWCIRMGASAPEFDFRFSADGHETTTLTAREFFDFPGQSYATAARLRFTVGGAEREAPVWTLTVTLQRAQP